MHNIGDEVLSIFCLWRPSLPSSTHPQFDHVGEVLKLPLENVLGALDAVKGLVVDAAAKLCGVALAREVKAERGPSVAAKGEVVVDDAQGQLRRQGHVRRA